ncbi:unnamed protein product, partial [marine sediment metagenome]
QTRERIVDIPVYLFKETYGLSLRKALEIYSQSGGVKIAVVSKMRLNLPISKELNFPSVAQFKYSSRYLILTDIVVKNKKIVTLKERTSFY